MYTPRTSVEAIPDASIHHSALQNRDFGHTYDRSRALVRALVRSGVQNNNKTMRHHFGAAHSCSSFADLVIKS